MGIRIRNLTEIAIVWRFLSLAKLPDIIKLNGGSFALHLPLLRSDRHDSNTNPKHNLQGVSDKISRQEAPWIVKRDVGVYTGINPVTEKERSRTPDLCVITQAQLTAIHPHLARREGREFRAVKVKADKTKSAVLRTPPLIAVEVVSPGSKKTDYENKELEYSCVGIPEY